MDRHRVIIVGGGTAGWMTAAYLVKAFAGTILINLIESSQIKTIGVGEATFSDIHLFFEFLGLDESDWMPQCDASYKLAIRFVNWNSEKRTFYHPFQRFEIVDGRNLGEWWLKLKRSKESCDYACFVVPALCDAQRSPRYLDGRVFDDRVMGYLGPDSSGAKPALLDDLQAQYPYAYHFDANLLAKCLQSYACERGVQTIIDDVVDVKVRSDNTIRSVHTREHGHIEGDLFIDCTGFRGLLLNGALGEPFISFTESLPCDRAISMRVPNNPASEGINPFTTATALNAGWVWNIPLFHRTGTGYVYSSAFLSDDEAELEFRQHLGTRSDACTASRIRMRVGRSRDSWVKNCVAIGLSSGFVEPLESTGIFFIQHGIEQLVNCFPRGPIEPNRVAAYNRSVADLIDGVREFLTLHYVASSRADNEFWKATKADLVIPDGLAERLELWHNTLPTKRTINQKYHGFPAYSYTLMLIGLGHCPTQSLAVLDAMDDSRAIKAFARIEAHSRQLLRTLPSTYEYLSALYRRSEVGMRAV
jgi:hypothetical protein